MANDFRSAERAQADLNTLQADRARLTTQLPTPWPLMIAAGAAPAWFVAEAVAAHPGSNYHPGDGWILAIAMAFTVIYLIQRDTGVRFRRLGGRGWAVLAGLGVLTLIMFSVALGIVSTGYRVWAFVPVLMTWALCTWGAGSVFRSCVESMRRG